LVIALDPELVHIALIVILDRIQCSDRQFNGLVNGRELAFCTNAGKQLSSVVHHHRLLNAVDLEKFPQKTLQHTCST
jgi:hypothetical protein